jgi:hypothetical protein
LALSLSFPPRMSHALPKITRENEAEAAARVAAARGADRDGPHPTYVPPALIDGVPFAKFAELVATAHARPPKDPGRRRGQPLSALLPPKRVRSLFLSAASPNGVELTDAAIWASFQAYVWGPPDSLDRVHYGPGREIYLVTRQGELAYLHLFLGPVARLVYRGEVYLLVSRRQFARTAGPLP